ncbi:zinc-binding dehydrogenase [Aeromicrobium piscarium]|uniref:zinc-binding dehydrogenase n=1 Tax=Aeromicrobium piscarium TaxID=2590901 RepID=UPI001FE583DC|nr:zinc-binding dehydrogenase [Aeromicrobium piscarium]
MTWREEQISGSFFGQSSFAREVIAQRRSVVVVDQEAPLPTLAPLGCAIQTGVGTVTNVLRPDQGDTLVVFGAGAVGLAAVMGAALSDLERIVVVDRVAERLRLAMDLGATDVIDASAEDPREALFDLTGGRGSDHAIEATGNVGVLELAMSTLASAGSAAVVGAPPAGSVLPVDVKHLMRGRRLIGVTEGDSDPQAFIPKLIQMYRGGVLPVDRLITHYPFNEIERAVDDAVSGRAVKPVLLFDQNSREESR